MVTLEQDSNKVKVWFNASLKYLKEIDVKRAFVSKKTHTDDFMENLYRAQGSNNLDDLEYVELPDH